MKARFVQSMCLALAATLLLGAAPPNLPQEAASLDKAVQLYRKGKFLEAGELLSALHRQHPEDSITTYYLAMSEAQLGRFDQARALYETVILLDPNSKAAELAKAGLQYLPARAADNLDLPPRFERPEHTSAPASQPAATTPSNPAMGGMSAQDMMLMQMMMSQGGGNTGGGFNPMMFGMMGQNDPNNPQGSAFGNIDPNVMSTMMMNQMLQNFNMMGDDSHNNQ